MSTRAIPDIVAALQHALVAQRKARELVKRHAEQLAGADSHLINVEQYCVTLRRELDEAIAAGVPTP